MAMLRRFLRHPAAAAGAAVLLALLATALLADWLAPRPPLRIVGRPEIWPLPSPRLIA